MVLVCSYSLSAWAEVVRVSIANSSSTPVDAFCLIARDSQRNSNGFIRLLLQSLCARYPWRLILRSFS